MGSLQSLKWLQYVLQADMKKKVEKWQEPAPAKQHKVLPVPDLEPKKRRGGRRFRKMKERYGLTDMRKAANRCGFSAVAVAMARSPMVCILLLS